MTDLLLASGGQWTLMAIDVVATELNHTGFQDLLVATTLFIILYMYLLTG